MRKMSTATPSVGSPSELTGHHDGQGDGFGNAGAVKPRSVGIGAHPATAGLVFRGSRHALLSALAFDKVPGE